MKIHKGNCLIQELKKKKKIRQTKTTFQEKAEHL